MSSAILFSGLVGSIIGGIFVLISSFLHFKYQSSLIRQNELSLINGLLKSLYDEMDVLWERYSDGVGKYIESLEDGKFFGGLYIASANYFTVYDNNSSLIGKINDVELRREIIRSYTLAKGLVDNFLLNNHLVEKHNYHLILHSETKNEIHNHMAKAYEQDLINYAKSLKQYHHLVKDSFAKNKRSLDKAGILSNKK